jgi:hypothetical protein
LQKTYKEKKRSEKVIWKLAARHRMATSTMKRIVNEDLGMSSRVILEKPVLTIDAHENSAKGPDNCS